MLRRQPTLRQRDTQPGVKPFDRGQCRVSVFTIYGIKTLPPAAREHSPAGLLRESPRRPMRNGGARAPRFYAPTPTSPAGRQQQVVINLEHTRSRRGDLTGAILGGLRIDK